MNVTVAWEDVISVVQQISGYLAVIGILFVAMIAALIFAGKAGKPKAGFIRGQSVIAFLLAAVVVVNSILLVPMADLISASLAEIGTLSEDTVSNSRSVVEEVAGEGIIMTKNDGGTLPLSDVKNLNVFGLGFYESGIWRDRFRNGRCVNSRKPYIRS